jgi:hypothetical protein
MSGKKVKHLVDCYDTVRKRYIRVWKEGREYVVQVWFGQKPIGEPDGDWAMPSVLGVGTSIDQAVLQTTKKK